MQHLDPGSIATFTNSKVARVGTIRDDYFMSTNGWYEASLKHAIRHDKIETVHEKCTPCARRSSEHRGHRRHQPASAQQQ